MGINHQKRPNSLVFSKNPHIQNFNMHQFTKVLKKVNSLGKNARGGGLTLFSFKTKCFRKIGLLRIKSRSQRVLPPKPTGWGAG